MSDSEELLGAISLARPPRHMKTPQVPSTQLPYASYLCLHCFVIVCFHLAQEHIRPSGTTEIIRKIQVQGIQNEAVSNVELQQIRIFF